MELVDYTYKITKLYPKDELFGLISQTRRAAVSIVANIAEGRGKATDKDFLKFLCIANGSLDECKCLFEVALKLNYIDDKQFQFIYSKTKEDAYLIFKLIKSIQKAL